MSHLSDVFKYISYFRHVGHQVGRKVGDMLEVLTYSALARENDLLSRLCVEPKLHGFSDAGHKVEFVLFKDQNLDADNKPQVTKGGDIKNPNKIIAFIECKRVGVEQTINTGFKKKFIKHGNSKNYLIPYDKEMKVSSAPRGQEKHCYTLTFLRDGTVKIVKEGSDFLFEEKITPNHRIIFALFEGGKSAVIGNGNSLRDYNEKLKSCRILEIDGANEHGVFGLLNDCLAGPQTPEKAKQSSFVALDVRKKRFNSFDKRQNEKEMPSILVLTEFSHWEQKSQNMIKSCLDKNFVIEDSVIVEAFEAFEGQFGTDFYDKITKDNYEKNADVKSITDNLVNKYQGKIFKDIEDGILKKIVIINGNVEFIS